jgi:hypothetical protein
MCEWQVTKDHEVVQEVRQMRGPDDVRVNPIERECEAGTPFLLPKRRTPGFALSITHNSGRSESVFTKEIRPQTRHF